MTGPVVNFDTPVRCGMSDPDPDTEAVYEGLREEKGKTTGLAECCGEPLKPQFAYRCIECSRWAHARCLARHFQSAQASRHVSPGNSQFIMVGGFAHVTTDEGMREAIKDIPVVPA